MTRQERNTLDAIMAYQRDHGGVSPSVREIASITGVKGLGCVLRRLVSLEEQGFIERLPDRKRNIKVLREPTGAKVTDAALASIAAHEVARIYGVTPTPAQIVAASSFIQCIRV